MIAAMLFENLTIKRFKCKSPFTTQHSKKKEQANKQMQKEKKKETNQYNKQKSNYVNYCAQQTNPKNATNKQITRLISLTWLQVSPILQVSAFLRALKLQNLRP